jgi:hypothetical protein
MRPAITLLFAALPLLGQQSLEILSARYGAGAQTIDVTERLRSLVRDNQLVITVDIPTLGSDPAPGVGKSLTIRYRLDGRDAELIARDFEQVRIPLSATGFSIAELYSNQPAQPPPPPAPAPAPTLRLLSAQWGADGRFADVLPVLEPRITNNTLSIRATNQNLGVDPAVGKTKNLTVQYEWNGAAFELSVRENATLSIPNAGARQITHPAPATPTAAPAPAADIPPVGQPGGLRIFYARYGADPNNRIDVRERLRPYLHNDGLSLPVTRDTMGIDPPGFPKILEVIYEFRGRTFLKEVQQGGTLTLP